MKRKKHENLSPAVWRVECVTMAQLSSLAGCPTASLHMLYFGGTDVSDLGPSMHAPCS